MGRMVNHYFHLPQRHPQQVFFGARFLSQQEIIFSVAQRYEEKATTAKSEEKKFKPTPIISPVYGILDKNYHKEDIVNKKNTEFKPNERDVRK